MNKIMNIIAEETNGKSFNTFKYSFDLNRMPSLDYENDKKGIQWSECGETNKYTHYKSLKELADNIKNTEPIIRYFLDGSRHVFKVDDITYNKQVYPVIAGQIGVGCCERINKQLKACKFYKKYVISLPDKSISDSWNEKATLINTIEKVNKSKLLIRMGVKFDKLLIYSTSKMLDMPSKLEDRGISTVQEEMIAYEKQMVLDLVKENKLNQDSYLLKDGSLEYSNIGKKEYEEKDLQKIKHNYRWVIGVSKSFNPESIKDASKKPNSNYIADLPLFCRTPVARYTNSFMGDVSFAVWYVRIRDKKNTLTPFDGVIKVEKILMDEELETGINSDEVDLITATLINERNPTCYGSDKRWANHLYPVYLTESYVKSKYLSEELFLSLF